MLTVLQKRGAHKQNCLTSLHGFPIESLMTHLNGSLKWLFLRMAILRAYCAGVGFHCMRLNSALLTHGALLRLPSKFISMSGTPVLTSSTSCSAA